MPKVIALYICVLFIFWLFLRDRKIRPMSSIALWIPLLWIVINGSRAVSFWLGGGLRIEKLEDYLEGSPMDRFVFLILISMAIIVLLRRKINWGNIIASNRCFFAFIIYCGISILWSGYSELSLKRYIKELGNVAIVLIILTEQDHELAIRAIFARYANIVIPLSVLLVKYYPDIGRYYNRWTFETAYCGIGMDKNALGSFAMVSGLFLIWDLSEMNRVNVNQIDKLDLLSRLVLLLMVSWLLIISHSSTSLVCFILGTSFTQVFLLPLVKRQFRYLGSYILIICFMFLLVYSIPGMLELVTGMVGRNVTLTGRTDIWEEVLSKAVNPLIGAGFESFWQKERLGQFQFLNQAHNGYLETYLQTGFIGLSLLLAFIISTGNKLKRNILSGNSFAIFLMILFFIGLFHNITEASFTKLSIIWIILIICILVPYSNQDDTVIDFAIVDSRGKTSSFE